MPSSPRAVCVLDASLPFVGGVCLAAKKHHASLTPHPVLRKPVTRGLTHPAHHKTRGWTSRSSERKDFLRTAEGRRPRGRTVARGLTHPAHHKTRGWTSRSSEGKIFKDGRGASAEEEDRDAGTGPSRSPQDTGTDLPFFENRDAGTDPSRSPQDTGTDPSRSSDRDAGTDSSRSQDTGTDPSRSSDRDAGTDTPRSHLSPPSFPSTE